MKRTIIKIDDEKCTGCGLCVSGCHEGALQIIDNKARLVSELFCDGLGACIGECPEGAIILEEREAEPYDEIKVMDRITPNGKNTILAHLKHLKEHGETEFLNQGLNYLKEHNIHEDIINTITMEKHNHDGDGMCGCPGSKMMDFRENTTEKTTNGPVPSQLTQWPIQLHLISPTAPYFRGADVVVAADCVAFSYGNFHNDFLKGKSLVIACPKLDSGMDRYIEKIKLMIDEAKVNTISVLMMEVPCCGGLLQMVKSAMAQASRKVPVKAIIVGISGQILSEEWV